MEKSRFVVEYLTEGGSDVESMFLEAESEQEAKDIVLEKNGSFSTILSCQLTKTCGGSGKQTKPLNPETETVTEVIKTPKVPKVPKTDVVKTPKVKNIDKVIARAIEIVSEKGTNEELLAWTIANVTAAVPMATWYAKQAWKKANEK